LLVVLTLAVAACGGAATSAGGGSGPDASVDAGPDAAIDAPDGRDGGADEVSPADVGTGPDASDDADGDDSGPITFADLVACRSSFPFSVECVACNGMSNQSIPCSVSWDDGGCNSGDPSVANCPAGTPCHIYGLHVSTDGTCSPCAVAGLIPDASIPQCASGTAVVCNAVPAGCVHAEGPYWCCQDAGPYE
jgi:hypothetical protein